MLKMFVSSTRGQLLKKLPSGLTVTLIYSHQRGDNARLIKSGGFLDSVRGVYLIINFGLRDPYKLDFVLFSAGIGFAGIRDRQSRAG